MSLATDVLWAPWRGEYVSGPKASGCIFCAARDASFAEEHLRLLRAPAIVMLNRFPYATAHLLVAPVSHGGDLSQLAEDEHLAVMRIVRRAAGILQDVYRPHGLNIGANLGTAAGAGIPDHLHWHLVPRWTGDINFLPAVGAVRVISDHLETVRERLAAAFAELGEN